MNLAHFAANINSIDTIEDMNIVIDLVSKRQKQLRRMMAAQAKATLTVGSECTIRGHADKGTCIVIEMRRTKASIETADGRTFEVPMNMLEA